MLTEATTHWRRMLSLLYLHRPALTAAVSHTASVGRRPGLTPAYKQRMVRSVSDRSSTVPCAVPCCATLRGSSTSNRFWYASARSRFIRIGLRATCMKDIRV